jgi:hypothetical protein
MLKTQNFIHFKHHKTQTNKKLNIIYPVKYAIKRNNATQDYSVLHTLQ